MAFERTSYTVRAWFLNPDDNTKRFELFQSETIQAYSEENASLEFARRHGIPLNWWHHPECGKMPLVAMRAE